MIGKILPAEAFADPPGATLFAEEAATVARAVERRRREFTTARACAPAICWDRLLFSAKESVYKAWFRATGRWLGFEDAEVTIDPVARAFHARLPSGWRPAADRLRRPLDGRRRPYPHRDCGTGQRQAREHAETDREHSSGRTR